VENYVETAKVEERLLAVVEELKVQELILVNPLSELVSSLPGFESLERMRLI
jgi:hypothetical protein